MTKILYMVIFVFISMVTFSATELTLWFDLNSSEQSIKEEIGKFNKEYPDIKINIEDPGPQDSYEEKLNSAMLKGKSPDLLWWGPMATGKLAKKGNLVNIEKFIKNDTEFDKNNIYDGLWEVSKYRDEIWSIPFDANNLAINYNKKLLDELNIDSQKIKTWNDFLKAAIALTQDRNGDGKIDQYGFQIPLGNGEWTVWTWQMYLWQAGGEFLDENEPVFYSAAGIKALRFWVDMAYKYKCASFSAFNDGSSIQDLIDGKVGMVINGPWNNNTIKSLKGIEVGAVNMPADVRKATNIGGENLYILKSTPEKEKAAWQFAKYIMSAKFQIDWAKNLGYLPICQSAKDNIEYKEFLNDNELIRVYVDQMKYGKARPSVPEYPNISAYLGNQIEGALSKVQLLETAIENAGEYAEFIMRK